METGRSGEAHRTLGGVDVVVHPLDHRAGPARPRRSAPLLVGIYARNDPKLWGFPFFYWFQFLLIPVAAALTTVAYQGTKGDEWLPTTEPPGGDHPMNGVAFGVFVFLFLLVTVLGFAAARWRRAKDLATLDEPGLAGRRLRQASSPWFLIGGDIYTAYTFIAVPATLYAGSAVGFFAVPYTIVVYPIIFLFLPRLWSVATGTAT